MWPGAGGKDALNALQAAGVSRAVVPLQVFGADTAEGMRHLAAEVINC